MLDAGSSWWTPGKVEMNELLATNLDGYRTSFGRRSDQSNLFMRASDATIFPQQPYMQPGENLQQSLRESPGECWAEFRNFRKRGKRGIASLEIIGPPNDVNMGYVLPVRQICATPERIAS